MILRKTDDTTRVGAFSNQRSLESKVDNRSLCSVLWWDATGYLDCFTVTETEMLVKRIILFKKLVKLIKIMGYGTCN